MNNMNFQTAMRYPPGLPTNDMSLQSQKDSSNNQTSAEYPPHYTNGVFHREYPDDCSLVVSGLPGLQKQVFIDLLPFSDYGLWGCTVTGKENAFSPIGVSYTVWLNFLDAKGANDARTMLWTTYGNDIRSIVYRMSRNVLQLEKCVRTRESWVFRHQAEYHQFMVSRDRPRTFSYQSPPQKSADVTITYPDTRMAMSVQNTTASSIATQPAPAPTTTRASLRPMAPLFVPANTSQPTAWCTLPGQPTHVTIRDSTTMTPPRGFPNISATSSSITTTPQFANHTPTIMTTSLPSPVPRSIPIAGKEVISLDQPQPQRPLRNSPVSRMRSLDTVLYRTLERSSTPTASSPRLLGFSRTALPPPAASITTTFAQDPTRTNSEESLTSLTASTRPTTTSPERPKPPSPSPTHGNIDDYRRRYGFSAPSPPSAEPAARVTIKTAARLAFPHSTRPANIWALTPAAQALIYTGRNCLPRLSGLPRSRPVPEIFAQGDIREQFAEMTEVARREIYTFHEPSPSLSEWPRHRRTSEGFQDQGVIREPFEVVRRIVRRPTQRPIGWERPQAHAHAHGLRLRGGWLTEYT